MMSFKTTRAPALAGLAATIAAALALSAGSVLSKGPDPVAAPPHAAVLVGADASAGDVADATAVAYHDGAGQIAVRTTGGLQEAQAQAAALAAQGYDVVVPAGAQARAALGQAAASELSGASGW